MSLESSCIRAILRGNEPSLSSRFDARSNERPRRFGKLSYKLSA
jgi:hypothetical protein